MKDRVAKNAYFDEVRIRETALPQSAEEPLQKAAHAEPLVAKTYFAAEFGDFREEKEVHDLKDAGGIDDEHRDEPPLVAAFCGVPERETLPKEIPDEEKHYDARHVGKKERTNAEVMHTASIEQQTEFSTSIYLDVDVLNFGAQYFDAILKFVDLLADKARDTLGVRRE